MDVNFLFFRIPNIKRHHSCISVENSCIFDLAAFGYLESYSYRDRGKNPEASLAFFRVGKTHVAIRAFYNKRGMVGKLVIGS
jgi:hypothetical protein